MFPGNRHRSSESHKMASYNVSNWQVLAAQIDLGRSQERILTLSQGGCGFYGFEEKWPQKLPHKVSTTFTISDPSYKILRPLVLEGQIIQAKPIDLQGSPLFFYGIKFAAGEAGKLQPVIEILKNLHSLSLISLSE
jgi:hypothetical protein